ncbi:hypothetical protein ACFFYR_18415 [Paraburkholderia dipogonis]|uniref:hypothetical protein n=1 Tax=Paraburkholderia dipogonis TaxID=1211383 RepID=UPI0035EC3A2A
MSDDEVRHAMRVAFDTLKLVVEPGGAAPLAAVFKWKKVDVAGKTVALVLSGGNVDADVFQSALGLTRSVTTIGARSHGNAAKGFEDISAGRANDRRLHDT